MSPQEPPASLSWSFNPWQSGLGGWRRPQIALPLSILIAVLLAWSVTYPNIPQSRADKLAQAREELGAAPFAMIDGREVSAEQIEAELEQIRLQREQYPTQWLLWSLIATALLIAMNASLYLPVQYELNDKGVVVTFAGVPSLRRWEHYRNFYPHEHLVHLTTMPKPSALDPFRGHSVLFNGNREEVLEFVTAHVVRRKEG